MQFSILISINQVCCKDLWYLEVEVPPIASRVSLVRASTTTLEVCWNPTPTAQAYILEVQKIEQPPQPTPIPAAASTPVTVMKKQPISNAAVGVPVAAAQIGGVGDTNVKDHIMKGNALPKVTTGVRAAAVATPISYGIAATQPILSGNTITSPVLASPINNASIQQPTIITTAAAVPTLVSTTLVCKKDYS